MLQHSSRLLAILLLLGCGFALHAADIDRLKPDHPRLLLDDAGLAALQELKPEGE